MSKQNLLPWILASVLILSGCNVDVEKGPFPVWADSKLISGKNSYLDSLAVAGEEDICPNIILILADDLGKYDISTYASGSASTPALDRLAGSGIRFSNAYATSAVCSPSRAGLMTGRYQQRFGFERQPMNRYSRNRFEYWVVDHLINTEPMQLISPMASPKKAEIAKQGIPQSEILLSEALTKRGYQTGIFGKWHLGHHAEFLPSMRGFGEQFGFYEAFSLYAPLRSEGIIEHRHDYFASRHIWRQKRKGTCAIRENDMVVEDSTYLTFSIAKRAIRFMEQNRNSPFFIFIPFSAPHTPFQVPAAYFDRFNHIQDHNKRVYYGMISAMDDAVQMIMNQLKKLGLEEETLVVFTSDNGGATYTGATDNGILKAGKFSHFEGGIQVPLLFSWKGKLSENIEFDQPVSHMDIYTTCMSLAGIELPGDRVYDGIDLLPYLRGDSTRFPDRPLYWRTDYNKSVRYGPWKMVWNERDGQSFLYSLEEDPGEHHNLAQRYPEKVRELKQMIRQWESEMMAPLWPGVMEFRFDIEGETTLWAI